MKDKIDLLSALLTPAIAIVTTAILFRQYRIEHQKWRLALFEKRYPVFLTTMDFLACIMREGAAKQERLMQFLRESRDGDLLFGDEVKQHLEELYKRGVSLLTHQNIMEPLPVGQERTGHSESIQNLLHWFSEQFETTRRVFYLYIKIDNK